MSNEALTWAFKQDLPMTQKFVLVALADFADENGQCFPKHETTAERVGSTVRTVQRALSALEADGYVRMTHQYRKDGRFSSNRYQLNMSKHLPRQSVRVAPTESHDDPDTESPLPRQSVASTLTQSPIINPHLTPIGTPKGTSSADAADEQSPAEDPEPREDVEKLCTLLADCIEANGSKRPTITQRWREAARLLIDRDGKSPEQVAWIIQWCQQDEFWRGNVLSMPTLRRQFDRLRLKAQQDSQPRISKRERENLAFLNGGQPPAQGFLSGVQSWDDPRDVPGQRALPMFGEVES